MVVVYVREKRQTRQRSAALGYTCLKVGMKDIIFQPNITNTPTRTMILLVNITQMDPCISN